MLIKKLPTRKISPLPPFLRTLVLRIFEASDSQLPGLLKKIVDVSLPKSDLNNWIGVLNKFDRILEVLVNRYELSKIQKVDFTSEDKELLIAILSLTKSLFEKCTNRNLYCSYERLNDLLNTNDLDVLEMVLGVIMRPAQRVNAQRSVRVNFLISQERIATLSQNWGLAEPKFGLSELSSPNTQINQDTFPIRYQFYSNMDTKTEQTSEKSSKQTTSSKKDKLSGSQDSTFPDSSQTSIFVTDPFSKGNTASEIFYNLVREHKVPEEQWYSLFQKVRIATAITDSEFRLKLLSIRLLALSVFCYVASETLSMRTIFVYEPNLIVNLVGLLHPDSDAPTNIQTAALQSLDSISHFSSKLGEVLNAVGASTNHGVLLYVLKKVIALENPQEPKFLLLIDALFSFLGYIFTSQSGGTMLVTAGIVSILVQFLSDDLKNKPVRLKYKGIQLMDNAIYGFPAAFSSFQSSNGLSTLVRRIDEQVDYCLKLYPNTKNPDLNDMEADIVLVENLILLKGLIKFVLHMMQTSSTGVGLRNLIDSTLPSSLKKIFENPSLFSPMVYGQAVNVMSTIIHNEPTSLTILQEQGLPQSFLKTAVQGFPAAAESLYPTSNAFGAICLNTPGLELFTELKTLDRFFEIFTSPDHVYILEEPEVLTLLGGSFDELTRHHPSLKAPVIENIIKVTKKLLEVGGEGFSAWAEQARPFMEKNNEESMAIHLMSAIDEASDKPEYGSVHKDEKPELFLVRFIDSLCKFLEGFFQNSSHFETFQAYGGYELLLDFYSLPAMPNDFPSLSVASSLAQVFRSANENCIGPIIRAVMAKMTSTLSRADSWLNFQGPGSYVLQLFETQDEVKLQEICEHGKTLHGISDLLSDFSDPTLFTQGNAGSSLLQAVIAVDRENLINRLGHVLRTTQWECIHLKESPLIEEPAAPGDVIEFKSTLVKNVYTVLAQTNGHLTGFFQGLVKISMTRRMMSQALKRDAKNVLMSVATELRDYFLWERVQQESFDLPTVKYFTTGLAFLTLQLLDRRHQMFLHLLMLMTLEKAKGFDVFFDIMDRSWDQFEMLKPQEDEALARPLRKNLEVGMVLMEHLCANRFYSDCPYLPNVLPGPSTFETVEPAYPNDYLSKFRFRVTGFLAKVWSSPSINRLTKAHIRPMTNAANHIIKNQTLRHDSTQRPRTTHSGGALSGLFSLRRAGPEQERVQQLVDMGFPRNASETALVRFGNNIPRATEYLLSHPEVVAAASFHTPQPNSEVLPATDASAAADTPAEEELPVTTTAAQDETATPLEQIIPDQPEAMESSSSSSSDEDETDVLFTKSDISSLPSTEDLQNAREELKTTLINSIFRVLDEVDDTVHLVRDLFVALLKSDLDTNLAMAKFSAELEGCINNSSLNEGLTRRLRLFGFLLIDDAVVKSVLGLATDFFDKLVQHVFDCAEEPPQSLGTALVVIDLVLMHVEGPKAESLDHPLVVASSIVPQEAPLSNLSAVASSHRELLTSICLKLLCRPVSEDPDVLIALVRLVVRLTRYEDHSRFLAENGGLEALLTPLKSSANRHLGQHIHLTIILRHLIESKAILQEVFEAHIQRWLTTTKSRSTELVSFLKHNSHLVVRDPQLFIDATVRKCKLTRYEPEGRMPQLSLIDPDPTKPSSTLTETTTEKSMRIPPLELTGVRVINYLVAEILSFRDNTDSKMDQSEEADNLYQCLLLQCLSEIFYSYPTCRVDFLTSSRNKPSNLQTKSRTLFINYLLNDLLPYPTPDPKGHGARTQDIKSAWASTLLSSLLVGINDVFLEGRSIELISIRRFVMDQIYRTFQDTMVLPNLPQRYGKLMALCDLCFKVLTSKRAPGDSALRAEEEVTMSIAKIMLDKHFVPLFISAINDLDLGFPTMKSLINALMRPLEVLSKIAIKLGHKSGGPEPLYRMDSEPELEDELSGSPSEDEAAEDFLRSSALGVIDGTNLDEEDDEMDQGSADLQDEFGYSSEASEELSHPESEAMEIENSEYGSEIDSQDDSSGSGSDGDSDDDSDESGEDGEGREENEGRSPNWLSSEFDVEVGDQARLHLTPADGAIENIHIEDVPLLSEEEEENGDDDEEEDEEDGEDMEDGGLEDMFENIYQGTLDLNADGMPWTLGDDGDDFRTTNAHNRHFSLSGRGFQFGSNSLLLPWSSGGDNLMFDTPGLNDLPGRRITGHNDVSVHPMLSNDRAPNGGLPSSVRPFSGDSQAHSALETALGISATRLLSQFFTNLSPSGANQFPTLLAESGQAGPTIDITAIVNSDGNLQISGTSEISAAPKPSLSDFALLSSNERWLQEARMMFGNSFSEKAVTVLSAILNKLIPRAIEERKQQEAGETSMEVNPSARSSDGEPAVNPEAVPEAVETAPEPSRELEVEAEPAPVEQEEQLVTAVEGMGVADTPANGQQQPALSLEVPTGAEEPTPITISIHGETIDITNTGIDPTFLEALPDDLRQEVLNQHFQENPPPAQVPLNTTISEEFLNAIPPELREEVLLHERHHQQQQQPANGNDEDEDEDEADPEASEELSALGIYTGDDDLENPSLANMSSHRQVALQLRLANSRRLVNRFQHIAQRARALPNSQANRPETHKSHTQAIQLVDRNELATLLRLIFLPQATGKHLIHRILLNLSENHRTCADLIVLLLSIVQDGADDLISVDRCFSNMSLRPKPTKAIPKTFEQIIPNLITQRCLEALSYLLGANDYSVRFCLKELDGLGIKKGGSKKHKSRSPSSRYPLVVLLGMLDRPNFLQNPQLMDQIMQLLSAITKVLASLVRHNLNKKPPSDPPEENPDSMEDKPPAVAKSSFKPPPIPDPCLNSIVNILASGECSNKTFQYTLSTIQHLLVLEGTESSFTSETIQRARQLSLEIYSTLEQIQRNLAQDLSSTNVQSLILTQFSPPSSLQAKLLRLLKTLDYMHTRKMTTQSRDKMPAQAEKDDKKDPPQLYQELHGLELWGCLSNTLSLIQEHSDLIHVATVLLPLIEAFMVICKHSGNIIPHNPRTSSTIEHQHLSSKSEPELESNIFFQFTEKHRKLLNIIIRNNPSLMSGTFELLIKNHKVLDFDNKRNYFNLQLHKRNSTRDYHSTLHLNVRRQNVFEDSFRQFQGRSGQEIKHGKLNVKFHDEEGVDAGGVTREWFSVLSRQMFNPNYALFKSSANDKVTYQPNRSSWVNSDHLLYFKFVGRIIGKAIYDEHLFDAYFTRSFYKHILGRPVEIRDLEALDPEFYKSMLWMLENDITDVVYSNFCFEIDDFGRNRIIELKPGGQDITLTQENKFEYVQLVTEQKLYGDIKEQIEHFLRGFHEIIPKDLISIFNEQELELLISGLPDIDIDDWKNNTDYEGYVSSSPQIQWFWRAVRSFDQSERAKLLQFVTGTSKVPLEGFAHLQGSTGVQKFQIHKDFASVKRLPSAHTCFNQLDIPVYESYDDLRKQLLLAIEECNTGFGFG